MSQPPVTSRFITYGANEDFLPYETKNFAENGDFFCYAALYVEMKSVSAEPGHFSQWVSRRVFAMEIEGWVWFCHGFFISCLVLMFFF